MNQILYVQLSKRLQKHNLFTTVVYGNYILSKSSSESILNTYTYVFFAKRSAHIYLELYIYLEEIKISRLLSFIIYYKNDM